MLGDDGAIPSHETEWKCTNTISCLNLGESDAVSGGVSLLGSFVNFVAIPF